MSRPPELRMTDDRWLSVEEISVHLGVAKDSIYRWIERRGLPAHKVGKLWKFKKAEVDAWVRSGEGQESDEREDE
jgi:excisionase family DNA binding protein